jgi:thiol-disulfide isomerase/thioredoxin
MLRNNRGSRAVGLIRMRATLVALALYAGVAPALLAQNGQASGTPPVFPDLEFVGSEGGSVRLSELKGNVVLLNVWATWCGPCKKELPVVQRMYDTYSDRNFVVLAVNVDADRKRVQPFVKQFNISLPVYYASPEDAGPLTSMGIPSTFILGPDRTLMDRFVGYHPDVEERWKKLLDKTLKARK